MLKGDAAQRADQHIGHRGEPQSQLIGAHRLGRGAVCVEVELAFLDAVLHLAAGAIELLIEMPALMLLAHLTGIGWLWRDLVAANADFGSGRTGTFLHAVIIWTLMAALITAILTLGPPLLLTICV